MARMLAAGKGDSSAWIRDSGGAREVIWLKERGRRSLVVNEAGVVGSEGVVCRIWTRRGRRVVRRGGVLESVDSKS